MFFILQLGQESIRALLELGNAMGLSFRPSAKSDSDRLYLSYDKPPGFPVAERTDIGRNAPLKSGLSHSR